MVERRHLGLLAKYWQPGEVKTRLGAEIGMAAAARLQRVFLETLLGTLAGVADRRTLVFAPPEREGEFANLTGGTTWSLAPQTSGDLGARMQQFLAAALAQGAQQVVLIGADSPLLSAHTVEEAFARLDHASVVFAPAEDGGYYLIGATREAPEIFTGIAWGTSSVFDETVAQTKQAGLSFATLPKSYDVDTRDDLLRLHEELRSATRLNEKLRRLRDSVAAALFGDDV